MNKSKTGLTKRAQFVQLAFSKPKEAAKQLKDLSIGLENCYKSSDIIKALSEVLHLSEKTILRDLTRD